MDMNAIASAVVTEVKSMLAVQFDPLVKRIEALEAIQMPSAEVAASMAVKELVDSDSLGRLIGLSVTSYLADNPPAQGEKGEDGRDGKDGIDGKDGENGRDGTNGLDGKDGINGVDGKDGENGRDGVDGKDGIDGKDGLDGKDGENGQDGKDGIDGKDGRDGIDGKDGINGEKGIDGKDGRDGEDGIGLAGAVIDRDGELVVTTTKGAAIKLGCIVGRDGADGVGFDDMSAESDGEGRVTLKFIRGQQVKEFPLTFEIPVYRGYWREGRKCEAGHMLTHEGSVWIAKRANCSKPCLENKEDWQLAVRKGRDGKDGANGRDLGPAPAVKLEPKNG